MTLSRLLAVFFFALIPLAALRALWWSDVLFGKPWDAAKPLDQEPWLDFSLLPEWFSAGLTLIAGLVLALGLDALMKAQRLGALPLSILLSALASALAVGLNPGIGWAGLWPMLGFMSVAMIWLYAVLNRL